MVNFFLVVTILFIVLSTFLKLRYVVLIYVLGNIILIIFLQFLAKSECGLFFFFKFQLLGHLFLVSVLEQLLVIRLDLLLTVNYQVSVMNFYIV